MTPDEILRKHEDANEMHFHEVDRKWIIEAMEEYAAVKSEKPINFSSEQTALQTLIAWGDEMMKQQPMKLLSFAEAIDKAEELLEMEKEQITDAYWEGGQDIPMNSKRCEQYYNETYKTNKQ